MNPILDDPLEQHEYMNRLFYGDPYSKNPKFLPLWVGPGPCPHELRIRTAEEIQKGIK